MLDHFCCGVAPAHNFCGNSCQTQSEGLILLLLHPEFLLGFFQLSCQCLRLLSVLHLRSAGHIETALILTVCCDVP